MGFFRSWFCGNFHQVAEPVALLSEDSRPADSIRMNLSDASYAKKSKFFRNPTSRSFLYSLLWMSPACGQQGNAGYTKCVLNILQVTASSTAVQWSVYMHALSLNLAVVPCWATPSTRFSFSAISTAGSAVNGMQRSMVWGQTGLMSCCTSMQSMVRTEACPGAKPA